MRSSATIRVVRMHGRDEVVERRAEAPFAVRRCGDTILLAATAAAPVGGDELDLTIDVGDGANARVGSVAAMMVWPAPDGAASLSRTRVRVGRRGSLDLTPEPTVSVVGSHHRSLTTIDLAADATCRIVEEFSLGRAGEPAGSLTTSLRVTRDGRPLLHHAESFGPDAPAGTTSVSVGRARHVVTAIVVGRDVPAVPATRVAAGVAAARLVLADDVVAVMVAASDRPAAMAAVSELTATVVPARTETTDAVMVRPSDQLPATAGDGGTPC